MGTIAFAGIFLEKGIVNQTVVPSPGVLSMPIFPPSNTVSYPKRTKSVNTNVILVIRVKARENSHLRITLACITR